MKKTITAYVHMYVSDCMKGHISVYSSDSLPDTIVIGSQIIEYKEPDQKEIAVKEIALLKNQIDVMSDAFWKQKSIMEGRIQSLLAIENGASKDVNIDPKDVPY